MVLVHVDLHVAALDVLATDAAHEVLVHVLILVRKLVLCWHGVVGGGLLVGVDVGVGVMVGCDG